MRPARRGTLVAMMLALAFVGAVLTSSSAYADHRVCNVDPVTQIVTCHVEHDPLPGKGHGHGGGGSCVGGSGATIPCVGPDGSYWNAAHYCYAVPMSPPPLLGDPLWQRHTTGAIYQCLGGQGAGIFWSPKAPPGPPPAALLAQIAATRLHPPTMTAASNGGPSHTTYVGIPTWLYLARGQWHATASPPAAVPGESVTATATPTSVSWSMGNGSSTSCNGPGAPFNSADPNHPPCGYTYRVDSSRQPQTGQSVNDRYFTVRGTVTWQITWQCTGNACDQNGGVLPDLPIKTKAMPLRVFQVETVVTGRH